MRLGISHDVASSDDDGNVRRGGPVGSRLRRGHQGGSTTTTTPSHSSSAAPRLKQSYRWRAEIGSFIELAAGGVTGLRSAQLDC